MELKRKLGIVVVFGIPAIIGAGAVWELAANWQMVFAYLGLLGFMLLAYLANPEGVVNRIPRGDRHTES